MTVKELVERLGKYPDNLRVVVDGYEDDYGDLSSKRISTTKIQLNAGTYDWEGQHSDVHSVSEAMAGDVEIVEALVFCRVSN